MQFDTLRTAYLDYVNNYLTPKVYGECNGLTEDQARRLLDLGKECHETYCAIMRIDASAARPSDRSSI